MKIFWKLFFIRHNNHESLAPRCKIKNADTDPDGIGMDYCTNCEVSGFKVHWEIFYKGAGCPDSNSAPRDERPGNQVEENDITFLQDQKSYFSTTILGVPCTLIPDCICLWTENVTCTLFSEKDDDLLTFIFWLSAFEILPVTNRGWLCGTQSDLERPCLGCLSAIGLTW